MKILLSIILIAYFNFAGISQNCEDLKTGNWKVIDDNDENNNTFISREDGYQIEDTPALGLKVKSKVIWNSKCSYTLKIEEVIENKYNIDLPPTFFNNDVKCTIIEQTDEYYIARVTLEGIDDFEMEIKYLKQ